MEYDGRTGHSITLIRYDETRDRFVYHDPWPAASLLSRDENMAGVEAQPEGKRWSVTSAELERVIVACFVWPWMWARLQGTRQDLFYDTWKHGEFFTFFHLQQLDETYQNGVRHTTFAPQAFRDPISLLVCCVETGRIVRATLQVQLAWVAANRMLALDLAKSFVDAFAPAAERETYGSVADGLWRGWREQPDKNGATDANRSEAHRCVQAFATQGSGQLRTDFASLSMRVLQDATPPVMQLAYVLY